MPELVGDDLAARAAQVFEYHLARQLEKPRPSLFRALLSTYGWWFFRIGLWKVPQDCLIFMGPVVLQQLIIFCHPENSEDTTVLHGLGLVLLLFCSSFIQSLCLHRYFFGGYRMGMHIRSSIAAAVFRKTLRLSNSARAKITSGEVVNLMNLDVQKIMDTIPYLHNLVWSAVLQITVSMVMLYNFVGVAAFAGLAVLITVIPLNSYLMKRLRGIQESNMKLKDSRMKRVKEMLHGMRVIKCFAWEQPIMKKVQEFRSQEMAALRKYAVLASLQSIFWNSAPVTVSIATFGVFAAMGGQLSLELVFPSLAIINIMRFPLNLVPMLVAWVVAGRVSMLRLQDFFTSEDLVHYVTPVDEVLHPRTAIKITDASLRWGDGENTLRGISLTVPKGSLTAVVGMVGSGKSTLISALLGDLDLTHGSVQMSGSVAYVAQQAWIQNCSLRDNILCGLPYDEAKYQETLRACALQRDLEILTHGDATEIGERGINLSGGQKQRVALARAVYSDADVLLLDDPLSAVDSHVGNHIITECLLGALSKKTRVLVTHRVDMLSAVDQVIVLRDGKIDAAGTYTEVLKTCTLLQQTLATSGDTDTSTWRRDVARRDSFTRRDSFSSPDVARQDSASVSEDPEEAPATPEKPAPPPAAKPTATLIQDETVSTGAVTSAVYSKYIHAIGACMCGVIFCVGLTSQAVRLGTDWWLSAWASAADANNIAWYLGLYGVWNVSQAFTSWCRDVLLLFFELRASTRLHNAMLQAVMSAPMEFFDTTPVGRILNRFSKDQDSVDDALPRSINSLFATFLQVFGTLCAICVITPVFLIGLVPLAALYRQIQDYYRHTSREIKRVESVVRSPLYSHFSETLNGVSTVRAFGWSKRFCLQNLSLIDKLHRVYLPNQAANRWLGVRVEFVGNGIVTLASLSAVIFALAGWVTPVNHSMVGLSLTFAFSVTNTLGWMVRMSADSEANMNSVERLCEYGDLPSEENAVSAQPAEGSGVEMTPAPLPADWPARGEVVFQSVAMRYREGLDLVLRDVTVKIAGGHKIGVCGRTGAGKSSLIAALFRLCEVAKGRILIDQKDISQVPLHDLRSRLSIVPQDPVLFTGTVRYNLDPFDEYPDSRVWEVVEEVHLKGVISRLEGKLSAPVAENGENFSAGERQLFCMARALLRRAKIIVLDEATAAADVETDALIQTAIRTSCSRSTVITIAHRLHTIMDYDEILVMHEGKVGEWGPPKALLAKENGLFAEMVRESQQATTPIATPKGDAMQSTA